MGNFRQSIFICTIAVAALSGANAFADACVDKNKIPKCLQYTCVQKNSNPTGFAGESMCPKGQVLSPICLDYAHANSCDTSGGDYTLKDSKGSVVVQKDDDYNIIHSPLTPPAPANAPAAGGGGSGGGSASASAGATGGDSSGTASAPQYFGPDPQSPQDKKIDSLVDSAFAPPSALDQLNQRVKDKAAAQFGVQPSTPDNSVALTGGNSAGASANSNGGVALTNSNGGANPTSFGPQTYDDHVTALVDGDYNSKSTTGGVATTTAPDSATSSHVAAITNDAPAGANVATTSSGTDGDKSGASNSDKAKPGISDADCAKSTKIDGNMSCSATRMWITGGQLTNQLGQAAGSLTTQITGNAAQQQAMQSGTQTGAAHAAATTMEASGGTQLSVGTMNLIMGAAELTRAAKHKANAATLNSELVNRGDAYELNKGGTQKDRGNENQAANGYFQANKATDESGRATNLVKMVSQEDAPLLTRVDKTPQELQAMQHAAEMDPSKQAAYDAALATNNTQVADREREKRSKLRVMSGKATSIASEAAAEQKKMADDATAAGGLSLIQGIAQAAGGAMNIAAGVKLDKAANAMAAAPVVASGIAPAADNPNFNNTSSPGSTTIQGGASAPTGAAATATSPDTALGNLLGKGVDTQLPNLAPPAGPSPTPFGGGLGSNPSGASGIGGVDGGSNTSAATGAAEDPQARYADNKGNSPYSMGGSYGGGASGGAVGADKGPDLSNLLAQFLPKAGEEAKNPNGILDFGSRGLAGEGPVSLLDRNTNIFDRIHDTYQDKQKHKDVGL